MREQSAIVLAVSDAAFASNLAGSYTADTAGNTAARQSRSAILTGVHHSCDRELVKGSVAADDPAYLGEPAYQCQYFRLTPEVNGTIEIVFTVLPHPTGGPNIDLSFTNPELLQWWAPVDAAPVQAGVTYQITLWEYDFPGVEFEVQAVVTQK